MTGADIDLTKLPVHLQHGKDGGLYISAGMDFARDPATGCINVGLRRFMLHGRATTGIDLVAPSDLRNIYLATLARGERLPLSVVVGGHPVDYFGATMRMPGDELALLASLRAAPMPVVKCVTNDLRVPADAEWVLEGYLGEEGYQEPEGPYGEFLGYYGGVKTNPIFHVTAITRRRDALFQTLTIGGATMSRTDTAQLTHAAHRGAGLARARDRDPRAGRGLCAARDRRRLQCAHRHAPARAGRGAQRHRGGVRLARQRQERVRGRSRHRHLLRRADGMGARHALPARPRLRGARAASAPSRSIRRSRAMRSLGAKAGYDLHHADRHAEEARSRNPRAAALSKARASHRSRTRCATGRNSSSS